MLIIIDVILPIAGYGTGYEHQSISLVTLYSSARMQPKYYKKSLVAFKPK